MVEIEWGKRQRQRTVPCLSNPKGKDSWHPDLDHPSGVKPHWDYNDGLGHKWRVFPDRIEFVP